MELKFNEATTVRPKHLERCLCYDKFLKGYCCYVYDDISKYWCTQATTEHDPDGENHIVDYADYQVTEWASLQQDQDLITINKKAWEAQEQFRKNKDFGKPLQQEQPSLPDNLDEAAEKQARSFGYMKEDYEYKELIETFKAGAEWMAKQGFISEGIINQTSGEDTMIDLNEYIGYLEDCEKVIVNIRKKEE